MDDIITLFIRMVTQVTGIMFGLIGAATGFMIKQFKRRGVRPLQSTNGIVADGKGGWIDVKPPIVREDGSWTQHIYGGPDKDKMNLYGHWVRGVNQKGETFENEKHPVEFRNKYQ